MGTTEPLTNDHFYHIYNRGINGSNIFSENENYSYFLKLCDKHLSPITDVYAWVLMPNHFHFLLRVKENLTCAQKLSDLKKSSGLKPPHQYLSNLFNAYSKAYNKRNHRHGALFERPFRRKTVHTLDYLRQLVLYIHLNPIHHGFCRHPLEYNWSSYKTCLSDKPTRLCRKEVISWFDDEENFISCHQKTLDIEAIEMSLKLNQT
jgi:REP element-mobilizing transposase RayT